MRMKTAAAILMGAALAVALAACGGGGGKSKQATRAIPTHTPAPPAVETANARKLHLGVGEFSAGDLRGLLQRILMNPFIRDPNCAEFLAQSDIDAERNFEDKNNKANPNNAPHLTPVAEDQVLAGQILKDVCQKLSAGTPTPNP